MTNFLLRRCRKQGKDVRDPAVRAELARIASGVGIVCNLLPAIGKLIVGLSSGSVAIAADAVNHFSDAASSVVTMFGFRLARRPADRDHPFGHARYEYLSGLMIAVLILFVGVETLKSSVERIFHPQLPHFSAISMAVLIVSVLIKLWMMVFFRTLGREIDSAVLLAVSADSRNDVMTTSAVLVGCLLGRAFSLSLDGYLGLAVALFILRSGIGLVREALSPLLGRQVDSDTVEAIHSIVLAHEKVLGSHDLMVHDYGAGSRYASIHVEFDADEDALVCHDIIDDIEWSVLEKLHVNLVIHYDPVVHNDAERDAMYRQVETIVCDMDEQFSLHDFRLVRGAKQPKLVFDVSVPYSMLPECRAIKERIDEAIAALPGDYITVIRFDGK